MRSGIRGDQPGSLPGHGRHRPDQPAVRGLVLGHGARPAVPRQAGQHAGRLPAAAGRPDAGRAHRHPDRRERRGDRLRALRPGRHRRRHRDERPAVPDEGDPDRAEAARGVHGRRRAVGHGAGGLLRRPGRRHLHRRGRGDLAPVPRRVGAGAAPVPLRAGREDRHGEGADAPVRPAQDAALRSSAASSSRAAARSSASSATSSSPSAAGPGSRPAPRSSPSSRRCAPRGCGSSSSSTTT